VHRGAEVTGFNVADFFPGDSAIAGMGRAKQMALAAAKQCLEDSRYPIDQTPFRVGVVMGTTMGESKSLERCTDSVYAGSTGGSLPEAAITDYPAFTIPQAVARHFHCWGPNMMIPNACAAGNFSIGHAIDCIRSGEADAMIAGGADAFSRYAYSGFARLGAISPDVPRPFSRGRQGMIPGEGAAVLFLESYLSAKERNAPIYAEIVGYGESCDAHHITQPDEGGIGQAMRSALAGASEKKVSFVSVHGTGTQANDAVETRALKSVFPRQQPPITSVKSMIGHAMGAASAIECVASLLSMQYQYITPTANFQEWDEDCDLDCTPNEGRAARVDYVLKTSSAFGGNNAAILFKRIESI
jgi:3-oxoacyl-[acyl-carrier-protein] synthase II